MFEGDGVNTTIKIIDFGRSRILEYKQQIKELAGSVFYIAPEVLASQAYDEKCDIWSCGVLMYLLLVGFPPFTGRTRDEVVASVIKGKAEFSHPNWNKVSEEAKELIQLLLAYDPKTRISAGAALKHKWIQKHVKQVKVRISGLRHAIENLKSFRVQMVFQQAVLSYIASQQMRSDDEIRVRELYTFLDVDKDGQVSKQDLIQGFMKLYGDMKKAKREAEIIFKNIDLDRNMCIGYNGSPLVSQPDRVPGGKPALAADLHRR